MSSDTPNDIDPMKSLRVVLSQSHTSTDSRRSLSAGFSLLEQTDRQARTRMKHYISAILIGLCRLS